LLICSKNTDLQISLD